MRAKWSFVGVVLTLLFLAVPLRPAAAVENEAYGLTPQPEKVDGTPRRTFVIPLEAGAVFQDSIRIYNRTDQPLELAVYPADAEAGVDGTISVGFRGSRPTGVGAWIDVSRDQVNLPPRGEIFVTFRASVRSSDPNPDLGAIVVENTARGIAADLAQRLHIVVRTSPPNTSTTSARVRPLLLRSPWIIIAILGLLVAIVIIWLGARRARRPKDTLVPTGELDDAVEDVQAASRPVLRRLGEVASRERRPQTRAPRREEEPDARPFVDEALAELDVPSEEVVHVPAPKPRRRPARVVRATKPAPSNEPAQVVKKKKYIPLDDL